MQSLTTSKDVDEIADLLRDVPESSDNRAIEQKRLVNKNALPHAIDNIRRVFDAKMIVESFIRLQKYNEATRIKLDRFAVRQRIRMKKRVLRASEVLQAQKKRIKMNEVRAAQFRRNSIRDMVKVMYKNWRKVVAQ